MLNLTTFMDDLLSIEIDNNLGVKDETLQIDPTNEPRRFFL